MGLAYLPTWMVEIYGRLVGKYAKTFHGSSLVFFHNPNPKKSSEKRNKLTPSEVSQFAP